MENLKRIDRLGGLELHILTPGDIERVQGIIQNTSAGIVLMSENAFINTRRIDQFCDGKVAQEAVDLRYMEGNPWVLDLIRKMQRQKNTAYFPGTVLQDFGGYCLPTMPVIINGNLDLRVKVTANECVDSYPELARRLFDEKYAEEIRKCGGFFCDQPMKGLVDRLKQESAAVKSIKSYLVKGIRVLPLICNEISCAAQEYHGPKVDIVLHSADSLYLSQDQRERAYEKFLFDMVKQEKFNGPAFLAYAEAGLEPRAGILSYSGGSIVKIE